MKLSLNYLFFIIIIIFGQTSFGQKKVKITVKFPSGIDYAKIGLSYHNGQAGKEIKPIITDNTFIISDICYSRYATITFYYPDSTETDGITGVAFWVSGMPANISFYQDSMKNKNPFKNYRLSNALALADNGVNQFYKFVATELEDYNYFYIRYRDSITSNKKYENILNEKIEKIERKELKFIQLNANHYYSLWAFRHEVLTIGRLRADSL